MSLFFLESRKTPFRSANSRYSKDPADCILPWKPTQLRGISSATTNGPGYQERGMWVGEQVAIPIVGYGATHEHQRTRRGFSRWATPQSACCEAASGSRATAPAGSRLVGCVSKSLVLATLRQDALMTPVRTNGGAEDEPPFATNGHPGIQPVRNGQPKTMSVRGHLSIAGPTNCHPGTRSGPHETTFGTLTSSGILTQPKGGRQ